jgi:hypothetical protein
MSSSSQPNSIPTFVKLNSADECSKNLAISLRNASPALSK